MLEIIQIVELLFRGPSGWLVIGVSTAISVATGYFGAKRRFKNVRSTTHAYVGGEKGFETRNESDIDEMFRCFERYEDQVKGLINEFDRAKGGARADIASHILKVADRMLEECDELLRMNMAFRTQGGHRQFLDQIDDRRAEAKQLRKEALRVQQQGQQLKVASA